VRNALGRVRQHSLLAVLLTAGSVASAATIYSVPLASGSSVNAASGRSNSDALNCGDTSNPCTLGGGVATGGFIYGDAFTP